MTELARIRRGRLAYAVTGLIATAGAVAAVTWAAATTPHPASAAPTVVVDQRTAAQQRIAADQAALRQIRVDITRLTKQIATLPSGGGNQVATAPTVIHLPAAPLPAPPVHTTTGASGVVH